MTLNIRQKDLKFFRPEWTCGRYNSEKRVALIYNLIEGMSYFLEDDSADVIGVILESPRNGEVKLDDIKSMTGLRSEELMPFLEELRNRNLLTQNMPTQEGILQYRTDLAEWKKRNPLKLDNQTKEKLPFEVSNAEMAYSECVGGVTSVMLELTYVCSEKCIHCYNVGASRPNQEENQRDSIKGLSLDDYKRIIDELDNQGLFKVSLSGGDPFSNPLAWEIIEYLYEKEIAFDILTNGQTLLGKVKDLANFYPRSVGISIYSADPETHDEITRIRGSWNKSVEVLRELGDLSVPLNVKCCVMQPNYNNYKGVAEIARSVGAHPQFEISVTDSIEGDKYVSQNLRLTPEQYENVLRDDNIPLYVGPEAPNFGGQKKNMKFKGCGAGDNSFCIRPDGALIPCCAFHLIFGNLKETPLHEILESQKLKNWRNYKLEDSEECGQHDYCDYCNLCVGNAFSEHKDYSKASENCCYIAKIRFNLAKKLMEETYEKFGQLIHLYGQAKNLEEKEGILKQMKINLLVRNKNEKIVDLLYQNYQENIEIADFEGLLLINSSLRSLRL